MRLPNYLIVDRKSRYSIGVDSKEDVLFAITGCASLIKSSVGYPTVVADFFESTSDIECVWHEADFEWRLDAEEVQYILNVISKKDEYEVYELDSFNPSHYVDSTTLFYTIALQEVTLLCL